MGFQPSSRRKRSNLEILRIASPAGSNGVDHTTPPVPEWLVNRTGPVDRTAPEVLREWLQRGSARAVRMNKAGGELHFRELEVIIDDQNPLVAIAPLDFLER